MNWKWHHDGRARIRWGQTRLGEADAAAGKDPAGGAHGRGWRRQRRGRCRGRGGAAWRGAARRSGVELDQFEDRDFSGQLLLLLVVVVLVVVLFVFLVVAVGFVRVARGDLWRIVMTRVAAAELSGWLTTILRPAGALDDLALGKLRDALAPQAASSDMVIVDLTAAEISLPRALADSLRAPALDFEREGRCLLVVGASPDLARELDRAAVPVITLAANVLPRQGR